jgi:hypothetical protein
MRGLRRYPPAMAEQQASAGDGHDERPLERWDRNLVELRQELRVAQIGVQILFAFLLTLPFTIRFAGSGSVVKATYPVTLVAAASASALPIAPVSFHRLVFRHGRKPELVPVGSLVAKVGLPCLLVSVVGAVLLVDGFPGPAGPAGSPPASPPSTSGCGTCFRWYTATEPLTRVGY